MSAEEIQTVRLVLSNYCARGCSFCSSTNFLKESSGEICKTYRITPEATLNVLKNIYHTHPGVKTIFFHDDDFLADRKWTVDTCKLIQTSKDQGHIPIDWKFMAQGSVKNVPYLSRHLARTGFRLVGLGVESFSPRVLKEFHKKQSIKEVESAVKALLEVEVHPYINLILSSPDSRFEDLKLTILNSIKFLHQGASIATSLYTIPFPGASIVEKAKEEGLVTYREHPIIGTAMRIPLAHKILPRDLNLRKLLDKTEIKLPLNLARFSVEKRFRSSTGPVMLYTILQEAHQMGLDDCEEEIKEMESLLCPTD
ncbi:MAG: radical SAM protein [Methanobacterium sp.]